MSVVSTVSQVTFGFTKLLGVAAATVVSPSP